MKYRAKQGVQVGEVRIRAGDEFKLIDGRLWLMSSKKPYVFELDPDKEFPYGNWAKLLEEVDDSPGNGEEGV